MDLLQPAILEPFIDAGRAIAALPAAGEHVSEQAIAPSLASPRAAGLARARADRHDARKCLISVTAAGRRALESIHVSHDTCLLRAVEAAVAPAEWAALDLTIDLLERIAPVELGPGKAIR